MAGTQRVMSLVEASRFLDCDEATDESTMASTFGA